MPYPRGSRPIRLYYSIVTPVTVAVTSGFEIHADASGKGVEILIYDALGSQSGGMEVIPEVVGRITESLVTVVPAWSNNPIAVANDPIQTTVIAGTNSSGAVASPNQYWMFREERSRLVGKGGTRDSIFILPGRKAVFLMPSTNVSMIANIAIEEL